MVVGRWSLASNLPQIRRTNANDWQPPTSICSAVNRSPMLTSHYLAEVPGGFGPAIPSGGNFDGVYRAHRHVIDEIVRRANAENAPSMVVSFEPHPARILHPDYNL